MSMRAFKRSLATTPVLGRALLLAFRCKVALGYFVDPLKQLAVWLLKSREFTNFTYDLDPVNRRYLAAFIAQVSRKDYRELLDYIAEVENDASLREHIQKATAASSEAFAADPEVRYGRRVGWYAVVRAVKPRVVVETGVDKGLGACVLTAALIKNHEEGHEGRYYGTDINPRAGYLLAGRYAEFGEVLYGDSIESLKKLAGPIDVFINDSDHSAEYEAAEYATVADRLSPNAVILGDNSHVTDKLLEFAVQTGRQFLFFKEKPHKHWHPGCGIGMAFRRQ
jgi:predicted O-methyltransferase YrrM